MTARERAGWWAVTALYAAGIWVLSSRPGDEVGLPAPWDKLAHLVSFAGLGFVAARASGDWRAGAALALGWGAIDEVHQSFVPLRQAGLDDWLADAVGGTLGALAGSRFGRRAR